MNKAINDILSGKGIPRLDMGKQKIFQGKGKMPVGQEPKSGRLLKVIMICEC